MCLVTPFAELAYRLSKGASKSNLAALQAACTYSTQEALVAATRTQKASLYTGFREAISTAYSAHTLKEHRAGEVPRLLYAAKCLARSDESNTAISSYDRNVYDTVASELLCKGDERHIHWAAAVHILRLSGLDGHEEFLTEVDTAAISDSMLPYLVRYAEVALELVDVELSGQPRGSEVCNALGNLRRGLLHALMEMLASGGTQVSDETAVAVTMYRAVANRLKKAEAARNGNPKLSECWKLAAHIIYSPCMENKFTPEDCATAQRFADAAEALEIGNEPLYEALHAAAQVKHRISDHAKGGSSPTMGMKLEQRAADLHVDAVRARCSGNETAASMFYTAAEKVNEASQQLSRAVGTCKLIKQNAHAAARSLLRQATDAETQAHQALSSAV